MSYQTLTPAFQPEIRWEGIENVDFEDWSNIDSPADESSGDDTTNLQLIEPDILKIQPLLSKRVSVA